MTAPEPDVMTRFTGLIEISLSVEPDHDVNAVVINAQGPGSWQAVMARDNALDLANRLLRCCIALRPPDQPDPGGAEPLSARF